MASSEINGDDANTDQFRASRDLPEMHKIAVEALEYDRGLVQRCVAVAVGIGDAKTDVEVSQLNEVSLVILEQSTKLNAQALEISAENVLERKEIRNEYDAASLMKSDAIKERALLKKEKADLTDLGKWAIHGGKITAGGAGAGLMGIVLWLAELVA